MRWFKHIAQSHNDEKLAELLFRDNGLELYGFFWLTIEIISTGLGDENQTFKEYSPKKWASFSGVSTRKFKSFAQTLAELGLFSVKLSDNYIRIDCPNILKYRDEYRRKKAKKQAPVDSEEVLTDSGQTPDNVAPEREGEREGERETDKPTTHSARTSPTSTPNGLPSWAYEIGEQYPKVDILTSFKKFKLYRSDKGKPISKDAFEYWVFNNHTKGWNQKKPEKSTNITLYCTDCDFTKDVPRDKTFGETTICTCEGQMVEKYELRYSKNS